MGRVYKATGINLKSMPLGESDRLLTILTHEQGLIRAVAAGARKPKSKLGGRCALFVVNELVLSQGRSLDRITQAETVTSFAGLSQDLAKLIASQYLAELALYQALSQQSQADLMALLCQQLTQLEQASRSQVLPYLVQGILQLLALAGVAPQVQHCCLTGQPLLPPGSDPHWQVGFSPSAGGTVLLSASRGKWSENLGASSPLFRAAEVNRRGYQARLPRGDRQGQSLNLNVHELELLQLLMQFWGDPPIPGPDADAAATASFPIVVQQYPPTLWMSLERALRHYAQYHFDRAIRSAALIDTSFNSSTPITTAVSA